MELMSKNIKYRNTIHSRDAKPALLSPGPDVRAATLRSQLGVTDGLHNQG
jgi:hypothetical protein